MPGIEEFAEPCSSNYFVPPDGSEQNVPLVGKGLELLDRDEREMKPPTFLTARPNVNCRTRPGYSTMSGRKRFDQDRSVNDRPDIACVASLIGDPARAKMLTALMSGKACPECYRIAPGSRHNPANRQCSLGKTSCGWTAWSGQKGAAQILLSCE